MYKLSFNMGTFIKGAYAAKFAREAKPDPANWVIKPVRGGFQLIHMGGGMPCKKLN